LKLILKNKFKKDFKRAERQNKPINILQEVIQSLLNNKKLDVKYDDHQLKGVYKNYKECHLTGNWLLIYKKDKDSLMLIRTGSHSELFS